MGLPTHISFNQYKAANHSHVASSDVRNECYISKRTGANYTGPQGSTVTSTQNGAGSSEVASSRRVGNATPRILQSASSCWAFRKQQLQHIWRAPSWVELDKSIISGQMIFWSGSCHVFTKSFLRKPNYRRFCTDEAFF